MSHPTDAQQKGLAFAPIPFAVVSIVSSSYVIRHLLVVETQKLKRLYQRLVLAMNVALIPFSFTFVWSTTAVPTGTPYYAGAMGTVATCTARGFINLMFEAAIPIYYFSLSLQAYMGIRNNFNEKKYKWIEKWIHAVAYCVPFAIATVVAATQNFNPSGTGCWIAKSPTGCEGDPDIPCERGQDIKLFVYIVLVGKACLYFILPPIVTVSMYFWLKKMQRAGDGSKKRTTRMGEIRETARKRMMHCACRQISVYLFSFWFTWVFGVIWFVYKTLSKDMAYNFLIFVNCVMASQGLVFTMAYFRLQSIGMSQAKRIAEMTSFKKNSRKRIQPQMTVYDIRLKAERSNADLTSDDECVEPDERMSFNIFDGIPDKESPWAMFIDRDDCIDGQLDELEEQALPNDGSDSDQEGAISTQRSSGVL